MPAFGAGFVPENDCSGEEDLKNLIRVVENK